MDDRTIGVLGGGQLGRMLVEAANNRNIRTIILDKPGSPAKQVNGGGSSGVDGSFTDPEAIRKLAAQCDILTVEIEHVDTHVLEELEKESSAQGKRIEIHPSWETIRTIQDKYAQKQRLVESDVEVAHSVPVAQRSTENLQRIGEQLGYPFMLKACTGAYDGRGNYPVRSKEDCEAALKALEGRPLYAERWAHFTHELAVMVVKTKDDADPSSWETSTLAYPTVETVHEDSICKLVYAPARISEQIRAQAQQLARRAIASFKGKGIFGVEMFLLEDHTILVNEIAPRPHNSGHYTIEACRLSQYDAHLLAILGHPIPAKGLALLHPAIMLNILGGRGSDPQSYLPLALAADAAGAKVHLYGKGAGTPGRKMGHLTIVGANMAEAEQDLGPLLALADAIRSARPAPPVPPPTPPRPLVAIISGSQSDQPHLLPAYALLSQLRIPFEKAIQSAHRTPHAMAAYAAQAPGRGIKVLIAAAGGAAHLPGMSAAFAPTLPVIGLPIKPSVGDGWDSLVSMTNMPRGVPVLTVGVNNAINAALGAARVLAMWDADLEGRLRAWVEGKERESLESDEKLRREGEGGT